MAKKPQINDLDLDEGAWRQYPLTWTDGFWSIAKRGHAGDPTYPGSFIPELLDRTVPRYTRAGELVVDLFAGSGTTLDRVPALGRRARGCDIRPSRPGIEEGDARTWQPGEPAQFVVLHPPYSSAIDYNERLGEVEGDLSLDTNDFLLEFRRVADNAYQMLDSGRHALLVMGDMYRKGEYVDLSGLCALEMQNAGFRYKSKVAKDYGNEIANANKSRNLWHLRALKGGFHRFQVEYVMVFEKPLKPRKQGRQT